MAPFGPGTSAAAAGASKAAPPAKGKQPADGVVGPGAGAAAPIVPAENDVLFGKGTVVNNHSGNDRLYALVKKNKQRFLDAPRGDKRNIAHEILRSVQALDPPGRFLIADPNAPEEPYVHGREEKRAWVVAAEDVAAEKIMRKLREKGRRGGGMGTSQYVDGALHQNAKYLAPTKPSAEGGAPVASWTTAGAEDPPLPSLKMPPMAPGAMPDARDLTADLPMRERAPPATQTQWGKGELPVSVQPAIPLQQVMAGAQTLGDWIASHRMVGKTGPAEMAQRREYLEQSVRLLLSLAEKVISGYTSSHVVMNPNCIRVENVVLHKPTLTGGEWTVDFVECGYSHSNLEDDTRAKYAAMTALGRVAYDMFMLGEGPSVSTLCSEAAVANALDASTRLSIHSTEEDEIMDLLSKSARTTNDDDAGIVSAMLDANVPYPCCRFVADLIGNPDEMAGRPQASFASFDDVVSDLKQMRDDPDAFLHASSPDRWKLGMGEKLYGRDSDISTFLDAAIRVGANDPLSDGPSPLSKRKEVVFVSGLAGSGKSRLARRAGVLLGETGWRFLFCKFDRLVHPEPLSVLASAFDTFFVSASGCPKQGVEDDSDGLLLCTDISCSCSGSRKIRDRLEKSVGLQGLAILAKHVSSLGLFLGVTLPEVTSTHANEETLLHILFRQLLQIIATEAPVILFLDDLQWADPLSLALLAALVGGEGCDSLLSSDTELSAAVGGEEQTNVLFVASYRENEVCEDHPLTKVLTAFNSDNRTNVTNVALAGFTLDTLNEMLSECMCLPLRRVRSLSEVVMQKTGGRPLHVIEFVQSLTANNLLSHSFARGWEFDSVSIELCPVADNAAELFALKLGRLPKDILRGVQIISCFGSQVDRSVLGYVADCDGDSGACITSAIPVALKEGLLDQAGNLLRFTHDTIQAAALESIDSNALTSLLRSLVEALIKNASNAGELDSITFLAVDFINRIGSGATSCQRERARAAELNLSAATKSLTVPDFASCSHYAENGISFLEACPWDSQYALVLGLYETAVLSHFSTCNYNKLTPRIDDVFEHAKSFGDKFKTHCIWIKLLSMTDPSKAVSECFKALEHLGEPLAVGADIDVRDACDELRKCRDHFTGEKRRKFLAARRLAENDNRAMAMKIMTSLMLLSQRMQAHIGAYCSCQIIRMTLNYGHCEHSVFGAAAFAACLARHLGDVDEATEWGNTTLSLLKLYNREKLLPSVFPPLYGSVFIWKRPIHASLDFLAEGVRASFRSGDADSTGQITIHYLVRSLNCGKNIGVLKKEVEALARQLSSYFGKAISPLLQLWLTPIFIILRGFEGTSGEPSSFPLDPNQLRSNDAIMQAVLEKKNDLCFVSILCHQTSNALHFRKMDKALEYADVFYEQYLTKGLDKKHPSIYNVFYEGLVAFYFLRQKGGDHYEERGENALMKMTEWSELSDWNFGNKVFLLEAEQQRAQGEGDKAAASYEAAIHSAKEHRFVHEEAMSCELAALFYLERGLQSKAYGLFSRSKACYERWGAHAVARRVDDDMRDKLGPRLVEQYEAEAVVPEAVFAPKEDSKKRQMTE